MPFLGNYDRVTLMDLMNCRLDRIWTESTIPFHDGS